MVKDDYERVVAEMRLYSGLVWSVPVTLAVAEDEAAGLAEGQDIALWQDDTPLAIMTVAEKYRYDKVREAREVYRTEEAAHPGVARLYHQGDVLLGVFQAAMRYAGPREAIFHALSRKNYGCTHFIVGRDHAGVGNYYGSFDAQLIFDDFEPAEIGITPLLFDHTFYCRKCGGIVSAKTCPHGKEHWINLSGTQVRQMLERGEMLPEEFTRPEVSKILMEGVRAKQPREGE
jgi:ATP sulfurylase